MSATEALAWTGERMVPTRSDAATELFHWQRYLFFRPWYEGKRVYDAACGEGYGTNFISHFATQAVGVDIAEEAVVHARGRYPRAQFAQSDAAITDFSDAELVVSFETIEHLPDPIQFLTALSACQGQIVISTPNRKTHSPGNRLEDKPLNPFHTIEWTPCEFAEVVKDAFPGRQVRFLSQEARWPGLIRPGLDDDAMYVIAVIGDGELPRYPRVGIAIPTVNNSAQLEAAVATMVRYYPGELEFAIVANGSHPAELEKLRQLARNAPHFVSLLEERTNMGYGLGANRGLAFLQSRGDYGFYGVCNDDVLACPTLLVELVSAAVELALMGQRPGLIGPVSNNVNGRQKVEIGAVTDLDSLNQLSDAHYREHRGSATPWSQVRGLFYLITPECLEAIGGFDPIFGLGNFEDDDLCLRSRLAGFTNWIVDGAFLFHYGSRTFAERKIDYAASIQRNLEIMVRKWGLSCIEEWLAVADQTRELGANVPLYVPLTARYQPERAITIDGADLDLFCQASDAEFAHWLVGQIGARGEAGRRAIAQALDSSGSPASAVVASK
jgi:GT2 family glycosyltransferase